MTTLWDLRLCTFGADASLILCIASYGAYVCGGVAGWLAIGLVFLPALAVAYLFVVLYPRLFDRLPPAVRQTIIDRERAMRGE